MSSPLEKKSQAFEEIVIDYESISLHDELNAIITDMVTEGMSGLLLKLEGPVKGVRPEMQMEENTSKGEAIAAVPISFGRPIDLVKEAIENVDAGIDADDDDNDDTPNTAAEEKEHHPVVGELSDVTFQLPENCIARKIDMDKIAEINPDVKFTFLERLKGWNIVRKQRPIKPGKYTLRYDTYFRNPCSRRKFRSVIEVVDFILYEYKPGNHAKESSGVLGDNLVMDENLMQESSAAKRKKELTSVEDDKENAKRAKEMVENFLKESWFNLMNSDVNSDKKEGDKLQEEYEEFSYHDVNNE